MRIIAGVKRGTKLYSPKSDVSRPITDRVKESVFNVLGKYDLPAGAVVADLFCGVGSMGIEALSRGAGFVIFVEQDAAIAAVLEKNISKCGFTGCSGVIRADAFKAGAPVDNRKYDLVFIDPPYRFTDDVGANSLLAGLFEVLSKQLAVDGIVMVRTERNTELLERYGGFELIERREWGTMAVNFLRQVRDGE